VRRFIALLVFGAAMFAGAMGAAAQEDEGEGDVFIPGDTTVPSSVPVTEATVPGSTPDTTIPTDETSTTALPAGCPLPPAAHAVFTGRLTAHDTVTARFAVVEVLSGSLDGFEAGGAVDVLFNDDIRFLEIGAEYLVSAGIDDASGKLLSRARVVPPMFGGDEVVGVNDRDVECPTYLDPLVSKMSDGTSIDTGVLSPMLSDKKAILGAFLKPMAVAFGVLVLMVMTKRSLWWSLRRSAKAWRRRRATARLAQRSRPTHGPAGAR
jgi:hypothetical protein